MASERLSWFKQFDNKKVSDWSFDAKDLHIKWFEGGKLNVSYKLSGPSSGNQEKQGCDHF